MKTVATYRDPYEAHLARALLESAGVEAFVFDDQVVGVNWLYSRAVGGVRLCVANEDEAEAREILADTTDQCPESEPCPSCGSTEVRVSRYSLWSLLPALVFASPLFFPRRSWRCARCGERWGSGSEAKPTF